MTDRQQVIIEVRGPGHHDRAKAASRLLVELGPGVDAVVETTLRPRLAADIEALLTSGAGAVVLDGPASGGVLRSASDATATRASTVAGAGVVVRLVADAGPVRAVVVSPSGGDTEADAVIGRAGLGPAPT